MLASPLLVGAIASGPAPIHALLGVWWFAGYFAFFATSLWLKSGRKARFRRPVAVYAASAAVGGGSQFLYFAGTVFYVKSMIRERGNERFHAVSVAAHGLATAAVAARSWWLSLVFAVLTLRAWIVPRYHLTPKQIGIAEIASTLVVAIVSLATL